MRSSIISLVLVMVKTVLRAALQREGMGEPIKEDVFKFGEVTREGNRTSLDEFRQSEGMLRVERKIRRGFDEVLLRVDRSFFQYRTVAVRFSGGGHGLPFLKDLVKSERFIKGTMVKMGKAKEQPQWQDHPKFVGLSRDVGSKFHRMAVALGGAYYCAESRAWLRLDDEMSSLGTPQGPTRPLACD